MDSNAPSSVAIIVLNWNGYSHSLICLRSLSQVNYPNLKIILVDNGSVDGSVQKLKDEFRDVTFLENQNNLGFTGGNNAGIEYALNQEFDHILLLNNDTTVMPDFLEKLVSLLESYPQAGMVQPLILFEDNKNKIWSAGGKYNSFNGNSITQGDRKNVDNFSLTISELDWATGCCILVSSRLVKEIGLLQNSYFAYFEDVDWSLRARKAGYKILLQPESIIYHEGSAASKKQFDEGILSPTVFYLHSRNQLFQLRRHVTLPHSLLAWPYQLGKYFIWMVYFGLRGRFKKLRAVARGIHHGIRLDHQSPEPLCP